MDHSLEPRIVGECQQEWHLLRRKYNLFLHHDPPTPTYVSGSGEQVGGDPGPNGVFTQFAYVDEPFLSWDFSLLSASDELIGSVNRNFAGFGREIFTDTGIYALRMDSASAAAEPRHLISNTHQGRDGRDMLESTDKLEKSVRGMTLDERAVMLATAVTIDFDYFSRHSRHGGGMGYFPFFGMGGGEFTGSEGQTGPVGQQQDDGMGQPGGQVGQSGSSDGGDVWPWDN